MHVKFICLGNICRSPMAERVAKSIAEERGVDVTFTSAGISAEEAGSAMDSRAAKLLRENGYDADDHRAERVELSDAQDTDLFVVAEQFHADRLVAIGIDEAKVRLITDYDPEAEPGDPLPDPWYGDASDFVDTLDVLERAIPKLLDEIQA